MKSRGGKSQRREEERRSKKRMPQKKEDAGARKGIEKSRNTVFFPMVCGSGGSKSRLAKAAGEEPGSHLARSDARRCGAKHISKSKCTKHQVRTTFGS